MRLFVVCSWCVLLCLLTLLFFLYSVFLFSSVYVFPLCLWCFIISPPSCVHTMLGVFYSCLISICFTWIWQVLFSCFYFFVCVDSLFVLVCFGWSVFSCVVLCICSCYCFLWRFFLFSDFFIFLESLNISASFITASSRFSPAQFSIHDVKTWQLYESPGGSQVDGLPPALISCVCPVSPILNW